jgi:hypothetical protein
MPCPACVVSLSLSRVSSNQVRGDEEECSAPSQPRSALRLCGVVAGDALAATRLLHAAEVVAAGAQLAGLARRPPPPLGRVPSGAGLSMLHAPRAPAAVLCWAGPPPPLHGRCLPPAPRPAKAVVAVAGPRGPALLPGAPQAPCFCFDAPPSRPSSSVCVCPTQYNKHGGLHLRAQICGAAARGPVPSGNHLTRPLSFTGALLQRTATKA